LHHPLYIGGVPMKFDASVNESYFGEKSFWLTAQRSWVYISLRNVRSNGNVWWLHFLSGRISWKILNLWTKLFIHNPLEILWRTGRKIDPKFYILWKIYKAIAWYGALLYIQYFIHLLVPEEILGRPHRFDLYMSKFIEENMKSKYCLL
jgi:hypothetical protein